MAMLARQAAEGAGAELTEKQLLQRDFGQDENGKYFDKVFSDPKKACRINPNKKAADRIEKDGMQWVRPRVANNVIVDENDESEFGLLIFSRATWRLLVARCYTVLCHPEYMDKVLDIQGNKESRKGLLRLNIYRGGKMVPVLVMTVVCQNTQQNDYDRSLPNQDENESGHHLEKAYARF